MAAAAVHLIFGSPGGRPSLREVAARRARPRRRCPSTSDRRSSSRPGCGRCSAEGATGEPLVIKVYGRDAWDTQLVTQAWRFLWYRHSSARLRTSRERQVEHEGLLLLLARTASVDVPKVRAVGRAPSGDTLLVVEPVAEPGAVGALDRLWAALGAAHDAGLSPCSIDVDDLGWTSTGDGVLSGWSGGMTAPERDAVPAGSRPAARRHGPHQRARRGDRRRARCPRRRRGGRGAALRAGVVGAAADASPRRRPRRHDRGPPGRAVVAAGHRGARARPAPPDLVGRHRADRAARPGRLGDHQRAGRARLRRRWPTRSRPSRSPAS